MKLDVKKDIDISEIISFDVFDTLVHRIVKDPVDLFHAVVLHIKREYYSLYFKNKAFLKSFKDIRIEAEFYARQDSYKRYGTYEITLKDIYETLFYRYNLDIDFLHILKESEIEVELQFLYPNPLAKELYEYSLNNNKIVIATTDMYLPKEVVAKVLTNCGYKLPSEIFCSGETKLSKHQGDVFTHILCEYSISPEKILHIGDHAESDFTIPQKYLLKASHFNYKALKCSEYIYHNPTGYTLTDSLISGIVTKIKIQEKDSSFENPYYKIGYEVFGSTFIGFFLWIISELKRRPVDKILFFARDAYVIRELFNKYKKDLGITIPEEYIYISRMSSLTGSFTDFTIDRLWFLFAGRNKKTVKSALSSIGIDSADILDEIKNIGFNSEYDEIDYADDRFMSLLIRIPERIQNVAKKKREILSKYIFNATNGCNKVAIIDIGWTGNMQGAFGRIAKLNNPQLKIDGYYLGTSSGLKRSNLLQDNEYYGYALNYGHPQDLYNKVFSPGGKELLELAFVAPHGTTMGYSDGIVPKPILESNFNDYEYQQAASKIQEGAFRFIEEIMPFLLNLGVDNFVNREWLIPFYNLVTSPSEEDAVTLGGLSHTDSAVTTSYRTSIAKKLSTKMSDSNNEYMQGYNEAIWKSAFAKLNKL